MKRLALILAMILMLVMPAAAYAEPVSTPVIRIYDPSLSMGGSTITIDGLALQGAFIESADGSLAQFIFDLFMGGENTNSAMIQLNDSHVVGLLSGMSNAYAMSFEDIEAMAAESTSDYSELMTMAEEWTLPEELVQIIYSHASDFTVTEAGMVVSEAGYDLTSYEVQGVLNPLIIDVLTAVENDEFINTVITMSDPYASLEGLTQDFIDTEVRLEVSGTVGVSEDLSVISANIDLGAYEDVPVEGEAVPFTYADITVFANAAQPGVFALNEYVNVYDYNDELMSSTNFSMTSSDADGISISLDTDDGYTATEATVLVKPGANKDLFEMHTSSLYYGDEIPSTIDVYAQNMKADTGFDFDATITAKDEYDEMALTIAADMISANGVSDFDCALTYSDDYTAAAIKLGTELNASAGEFAAELSVNDGYDEYVFGLSYLPTAPAAGIDHSGVITLSMNDGYMDMAASAKVDLFTTQVDPESFYVDPANAIDLTTITGDQIDAAFDELEAILDNIAETFESAYPIFFE